MHPILWLFVIVAGATVYTYVAFLAFATAKRIYLAGVKMPWDMRLVCYALFIPGWVADVIYNQTRGAWMFREFRGVTFSSRIDYYLEHPQRCPKLALAESWGRLLNAADPGHVGPELDDPSDQSWLK